MRTDQTARALRVVLASYDARELRVQSHYLEEQCSFLQCRSFCTGGELLAFLRQGGGCDVLVLGSQLADMDEVEFLVQLRRMPTRPLLLLFGERRHSASALSCLRADGACYVALQTELKDLLEELYRASGRRAVRFEALCRALYAAWEMPAQDTNCAYLTSAVRQACRTHEKRAIRKELLQPVSEEFHVSVAAIDSGLRRLVDELETRRTPGWLAFKQESGFGGERPATGQLLYAVRARLVRDGLPLEETI